MKKKKNCVYFKFFLLQMELSFLNVEVGGRNLSTVDIGLKGGTFLPSAQNV